MVHGAMTNGGIAGLLVLMLASSLPAQTPARLRWANGQVLVYKVEHTTLASDAMGDSKSETKSVLKLTRRWQVATVDAAGVATLSMSLSTLSQERTTPSGDVLKFDSAAPDKGTPQLKDYFTKFLNIPLATLRVDSSGRVAEVKESKFGPASNFESELPFLGVLPTEALKVGLVWERPYQITLGPPLGTGQKYDAIQRFTCTALTADVATVTMTTELKTALKAPADVIPLWQKLPSGTIVYDLKNGRMHSAKLVIDKELKGHAGEGSMTKFQSGYSIEYIGDR